MIELTIFRQIEIFSGILRCFLNFKRVLRSGV
ncbi:hypothetical protein SYNPCC7002_A2087 [Picosynechococcus sp. PCC 7002]|nr:hypothetical protein SYNPCC7002_A2087 [Picosynechococcus sp. PCC 7002]